jgi:hypothetical protein
MAELPGLCASVACLRVGLGPLQSATKGQQTPGTKSPAAFFNFRKITETCKIHILFPVYQKNMNNMSKWSEK